MELAVEAAGSVGGGPGMLDLWEAAVGPVGSAVEAAAVRHAVSVGVAVRLDVVTAGGPVGTAVETACFGAAVDSLKHASSTDLFARSFGRSTKNENVQQVCTASCICKCSSLMDNKCISETVMTYFVRR